MTEEDEESSPQAELTGATVDLKLAHSESEGAHTTLLQKNYQLMPG